MCVDSTTVGSPHAANTLSRAGATAICSTAPPVRLPPSPTNTQAENSNALLVLRHRLDVHQRPRQRKNIHRHSASTFHHRLTPQFGVYVATRHAVPVFRSPCRGAGLLRLRPARTLPLQKPGFSASITENLNKFSGKHKTKGRNHEETTIRDRCLSIALHPNTQTPVPDDSGQVLALPPNHRLQPPSATFSGR